MPAINRPVCRLPLP